MNKYVAVAGIVLLTACAESTGPADFDKQYTIDVPGNVLGTPGCASIDLVSCFAILDHQIKVLYERSAWAARFGEADYKAITGSNAELAYIFQADTRSVPETLRALDDFISGLERARSRGELSACWGDHLITFSRWIRAKVAVGDVDVSDVPAQDCFISAIGSVAVSGSTANGVVLTVDDPWHYSGDPYGVYATQTYFVVQGPNGTITTQPVQQSGPASVIITDPLTNVVGTYPYSVMQCSDWGYCSTAFSFDVDVVAGTGTPACVHDNSDKAAPGKSPLPKCKKAKKN